VTSAKATVSTTKKPALLRAFSTYANQSATVAGWGTTSFGKHGLGYSFENA
jgi:hypothetical protein